MLQIQYGKNLKNKVKPFKFSSEKLSDEPFKVWSVDEVKLKGKKYYLLINKTTKLIVLLSKLEPKQFFKVLKKVVHSMDYITREQQEDLQNILLNPKNEDVEVAYNKEADSTLQQVKHSIEKNGISNILNYDEDTPEADLAAKSNSIYYANEELGEEFLENIIYLSNTKFPIKTNKPNRHYQYINLKMKFDDFSKWKSYEYQSVDGNEKIAIEIKANNKKLVKQFMHEYQDPFCMVDREYMLLDYLNNFLLRKQILFATSNTGAVVTYLWLIYTHNDIKNIEKDHLFIAFISFHDFLSHVGLITKSDAEKIEATLIDLSIDLMNYTNEPDDLDDDFDPINSMSNNNSINESINNLIKQYRNNELSPEEQNMMSSFINELEAEGIDPDNFKAVRKEDIPTQNKERNQMTYEIRVKLKDFKPNTWRRFFISGNASIEDLANVVLIMFNANMGHLYNIYSKRTNQRFENPDSVDGMNADDMGSSFDSTENKISLFEKGDKLLLSYDYGDGWEFEITIKNISKNDAPAHPQVISGKGYGIIDSIGGPYGLQEYFDTPKKDMDPEMLDWFGGEKIDLLDFDIDDINLQLSQF